MIANLQIDDVILLFNFDHRVKQSKEPRVIYWGARWPEFTEYIRQVEKTEFKEGDFYLSTRHFKTPHANS